MPSQSIQMPDKGLDGMVPAAMLDPRAAAKGSQSIFYEYGLVRTVYGYAKLDLSTGLNSSDIVLAVLPFRELDGYSHVLAVTPGKIYDHDRVNAEWDDKTGNTQQSNITSPISYVEIAHQASETYINDDTSKSAVGYHLVICDGGLSDIQRWAGRYETDFANLTGGEDYHTDASGTTHRALQVGAYQSRIILLSPKDYNAGIWSPNPQMVRWPQAGYLQSFTGTGSGFSILVDTGGSNVWSAPLGNDYIIYQTRGIWNLRFVGSTDVFRPEVYLPDLGLLSSHLITSSNNIHYFVGDDYNVYAYRGGTDIMRIGDPIHKYLQEELNTTYEYRCWMVMGPENKWLWLYIVPTGQIYCTKAFGMNMSTGAWTERDFRNSFGDQDGITAVNLIGSESYTIGETYTTALATLSAFDADASTNTIGDTTERYGDILLDSSRTLTKDYSTGTWSLGGLDYSLNAEAFTADFTENDMIVTYDGSDASNVAYGQHYYTAIDVSANGFSIKPTESTAVGDNTGPHGIADASDTTPADLSVVSDKTFSVYSVCNDDAPGEIYNEVLQNVLVGDRLVIGDATGYVYQFDTTLTTDDDELIDSRHITPVIDWGEPDKYKRWPGVSLVAEGTVAGGMYIRHRTSNFETSETGWTDVTFDLTGEFQEDTVWINHTSKRIQFEFMDFTGNTFGIRSYEVLEPEIQGNR